MKHRLVELLGCPSHPNQMLRVVRACLSEVFPYSGELRIPQCRSACGLLGNWFDEIPMVLPAANRLNCRRCIGTEIESACLVCPECDFALEVCEGVLMPTEPAPADAQQVERHLAYKAAKAIAEFLELSSGDLVLVLAPLPETMLDHLGCSGVEQVRVELRPETVISHRARSCANGHGLAHYIAGPLDSGILRSGQFDAVVLAIPSAHLIDKPECLERVPDLLRPAGRMVLVMEPEAGKLTKSERVKHHLANLPASFQRFEPRLSRIAGNDLLMLGPAREKVSDAPHYGRKSGKDKE